MTYPRNRGASIEAFSRAKESTGAVKQALQNELVLGHMDIADSIARKFATRGRDLADLQQVAALALIKAVQGFQPARGTDFTAYAIPTISGEIKRYLRDSCWVVRPPRFLQDLRTLAAKERPRLAQRLQREPSLRELADHLEHSEKDVAEALNCQGSLRPESLEAPVTDEGLTLAETMFDDDGAPERTDDILALRDAVRELPSSERELLFRRYFHEETQQQIGHQLGMTQMQVSRLLARVLIKLQNRLLEAEEPPAAELVRTATRPAARASKTS
ncbi:sigma-70 family RNA polymerase sigma factor [Paenarthrobacter sp. Z7-10]|uniref:sigma-70 family RNA polymerase sigma factor n=1 Tax=Paenarthrobacter sp. Z7-10 TaxID=2787635 RepID=UPI0022A9059A|nr:sigma-70 family RNA polymerase sigma factor [Paenarthrobacter sp. Z7-10]MCZ2403139.1 sigma-70 family RNA polymerase sigma factor [Paenarthrobacter sp. Z7-10]